MDVSVHAKEYNRFIFSLINQLDIVLTTPGQKIVTSNEDVLDKNDMFLGNAAMFIILNGKYKV